MRKSLIGLAAAAALVAPLAMAGSANADVPGNLVANGSFEQPDQMSLTDGYRLTPADDPFLTGWTVGGGGVDVVDETLWRAADGKRSVDLNAQRAGSISQNITTVKNQTYVVSFQMSGNPDIPQGVKTMAVSAAGGETTQFDVDTTGSSNASVVWTPRTFTFVATGTSTTLKFESTTTNTVPNFAGPAIDNVVIRKASPPCATAVTFTAWEPAGAKNQFGNVWRHDYTIDIDPDNGTFSGTGVENGMSLGWNDGYGETHNNSPETITGTLNGLNISYTAVRSDGRTWVLSNAATTPGLTLDSLASGTSVYTTNSPVIQYRISTPQFKCEPPCNPTTAGVWHNYTGKYAGTAPVPPLNDPKWKASPATPGGEHDVTVRGFDKPYQTGAAKGNGSWFYWSNEGTTCPAS